MTSRDTSAAAAAVQLAAQKRLTGADRIGIALEMSLLVRELAFAGLRARHPDWSEALVKKAFLRGLFPPDAVPPPLR